MITVRHPEANEVLPASLGTGFEAWNIDREWAWLALRDGRPEAALLVAQCHGFAMPVRLVALPSSGIGCLRALVREAVRECRTRGINGFFAWIDADTACGRKLLRLANRLAAGKAVGAVKPMVIVGGKLCLES